jgi:hypothetical protein
MEQDERELNKTKNSSLSIVLILANFSLLVAFAFSGGEEGKELGLGVLGIGILFLLGGYAFSYHGKGYRIGKWLFGIVLIIAIVFFGLLWYSWQLSKGFNH